MCVRVCAGSRVQACAHMCACVGGRCVQACVWVRTCARACQRQVRAGQVCGGRALASLRTSIRATAAHRGLGGGESDAAGRARWYASQVRRVPFSLC